MGCRRREATKPNVETFFFLPKNNKGKWNEKVKDSKPFDISKREKEKDNLTTQMKLKREKKVTQTILVKRKRRKMVKITTQIKPKRGKIVWTKQIKFKKEERKSNLKTNETKKRKDGQPFDISKREKKKDSLATQMILKREKKVIQTK